ncbi:MAG: glycosyltransferase family 2 protein, partial [Gammaproteobacteria bacterium]
LADEALERIPGTRDRVLGAIRQVSERPGSPMYAAQCRAYAAWEEAGAAVSSGDSAAIEHALHRLAEYGFALGNPQGACLGADLLAEVWSFERQRGLSGDDWLERLGELVKGAIEALQPEPAAAGTGAKPTALTPPTPAPPPVLPAAICAALERVAASAEGAYPRAFLAEMRSLLRKHFGSRHEALFGTPEPDKPIPAWPQDTLVVVYSCRKYLGSRVQAIRETWLKDLDARGIPWLVAVGDGSGTLEPDGILGLRVSDSYEALPRKTLALLEWVYANTRARYVLKIDDDCYLDVARYFGTLSYRKHHYYGRIIRRPVGGTDRLWHQPKSQGELARKAIDKSPEPSVYADGGGAYSLSRTAVGALLQMSRTERGLRLAGASFMEDKLVGDLLAMAQIGPAAEDYEACQRRRSFPEAEPVAMWENTFFPSRITPVKVVHLDTERDQAKARELGSGSTLWPRKLWPSYRGVALNGWSNQLELLSAPGKALALARHSPRVVAVMRNERLMLPHFLAHYRSQGVRCFVIVDNCSDDGTREYLLQEGEDVVLLSADAQYRDSRYGVAWQQAVLANLGGEGWSVLADADELLVYPGCESRPLADFVAEVQAEGADAVLTYLVDMYPYGSMREADFSLASPFEVAGYFERSPFLEWKVGRG